MNQYVQKCDKFSFFRSVKIEDEWIEKNLLKARPLTFQPVMKTKYVYLGEKTFWFCSIVNNKFIWKVDEWGLCTVIVLFPSFCKPISVTIRKYFFRLRIWRREAVILTDWSGSRMSINYGSGSGSYLDIFMSNEKKKLSNSMVT